MIQFTNDDQVGLLPDFFNEDDPRPAAQQLDEAYAHGGGYQPFEGFKLTQGPGGPKLVYPGDPPMRLVSKATLHDEVLLVFECDWLLILQPDGTFAVTRVD